MRSKMMTKKGNYMNLDEYDSRVNLYSDDAFSQGLTFQSKLIGVSEVPRPNSRVEIVAAMRKIRYDCKVKSVKKRKVTLNVSVDGLKVFLSEKGKTQPNVLLMHFPVYRIFYVSHDSLDMNVYSIIAREGPSFKCVVFKTQNKTLAMKVVRAIGQAFEVSHKVSNSLTINNDKTQDCDNHKKSTEEGPRKDCHPLNSSPAPETPKTTNSEEPSTNNESHQMDLLPHLDMASLTQTLKIIEERIDHLSTKIEKMEENQEKLLHLLKPTDHSFSNIFLDGKSSKMTSSFTFPSSRGEGQLQRQFFTIPSTLPNLPPSSTSFSLLNGNNPFSGQSSVQSPDSMLSGSVSSSPNYSTPFSHLFNLPPSSLSISPSFTLAPPPPLETTNKGKSSATTLISDLLSS